MLPETTSSRNALRKSTAGCSSRAPSVNAVRRALHRDSGGVKVMGRHDRETILCTHTMDGHSLGRHWPVIVSRLGKAGLRIAPDGGTRSPAGDPSRPADPASD